MAKDLYHKHDIGMMALVRVRANVDVSRERAMGLYHMHGTEMMALGKLHVAAVDNVLVVLERLLYTGRGSVQVEQVKLHGSNSGFAGEARARQL